MKTSHKILVFAGIVPMFMVLLMAFSMKNILEDTEDVTPRVTKEVFVRDFSKISTGGKWRIHISQGDDFSIELEAPEKVLEGIKLEMIGDTLFLGSRKKPSSKLTVPQASIILPSISEIHLLEVTDLDLSGFDSETITLNIQGVSKISGMDSTIQQLTLTGNGVLFLDMSDAAVTNAHINYNGVYNMKMAIAGGRLSGHLSGIGTLHCRGDVGVNDIEVTDHGKIVFTE